MNLNLQISFCPLPSSIICVVAAISGLLWSSEASNRVCTVVFGFLVLWSRAVEIYIYFIIKIISLRKCFNPFIKLSLIWFKFLNSLVTFFPNPTLWSYPFQSQNKVLNSAGSPPSTILVTCVLKWNNFLAKKLFWRNANSLYTWLGILF